MTLLTRASRRLGRSGALLVVGVLALAGLAAACTPAPEPAPPPPAPADVCDPPGTSTSTAVSVMGPCPRLSVDQIVAWFQSRTSNSTTPAYRATVSLPDLVTLFAEEGRAEGVRGDLAFVQSIIETNWFSFSGRVPASANNFAGLGATDGTTLYSTFSTARIGVRAQIQHLRAYADAQATTCTVPPLANPCADPRFDAVSPKGKAPTWNQFGNGNWATDPDYATKILNLYGNLLERYGLTLA